MLPGHPGKEADGGGASILYVGISGQTYTQLQEPFIYSQHCISTKIKINIIYIKELRIEMSSGKHINYIM